MPLCCILAIIFFANHKRSTESKAINCIIIELSVFLFDIQQLNQDAFKSKPDFMLLSLEDTVTS